MRLYVIDKDFIGKFFVTKVNLSKFGSNNSAVLEVRIVLGIVFEKACHFLVVVYRKEIFQTGALILGLFRVLLRLLRIGEELILNILFKRA